MASIMDKKGKPIIPAKKGTFFASDNFGLLWNDGVIAVSPYYSAKANGQQDAKGKYWWPHLYLYDYSGRLIAKPKGYTYGTPLGGGYTLAIHQVPTGKKVYSLANKMYPAYWSVFDRNGNKVVEKEEDNYYLLNAPYGYDNGYIYFGETRHKVGEVK